MLYDFAGTTVRDCFIRAVLVVTLGVVGGGCGESDDADIEFTSCGAYPGGLPPNFSHSECGISICGAFYEYECDEAAKEWRVSSVQDCICGTGPICNPVTQAGCASGEKCGSLVLTESPFLSQVACVPDGARGDGESCTGPKGT